MKLDWRFVLLLFTVVVAPWCSSAQSYELPKSRAFTWNPRRSLTFRVRIGYDDSRKDTAVFLGTTAHDTIDVGATKGLLYQVRQNVLETEGPSMEIEICADQFFPAWKIVQMIYSLGVDGPFNLRFMVNHEDPVMGIPTSFKGKAIQTKQRIINQLNLRLEDGKMIVNDTLITKQYLYNWSKDRCFTDQYNKTSFILQVEVDRRSDYQSLISVYEEVYAARMDFISENVEAKFKRKYDDYESRYSDKPVWEFVRQMSHPSVQLILSSK